MKFSNLKEGDVLSETQYYTVTKKVGDKVQLENDFGEPIVVNSAYTEKLLHSADQFDKIEKLTRTELAALFLTNTNVVMIANYQKQVKEADVIKELLDGVSDAKIGEIEKAVKAGVKKAINGEERTIVGRHSGSKDDFGRVHFIDMKISKDGSKSYDVRQRLVDPRTLNHVIVKGVKYIAK